MKATVICAMCLLISGCERASGGEDFDVTAMFPHDASAYTQGLLTRGDTLWESAGQYGRSDVRRVDLRTGAVLERRRLNDKFFGEGLAIHGDRLYQLTWKESTAFVYDAASLKLLDSLRYPGEGWGLASDGELFYLSDGSDSIRVVNPATFAVARTIHVRYGGEALRQLNELEYFRGALLANVYETNRVAIIHAGTGEVLRVLDFAELYRDRTVSAEVMNGIAVAPDGEQFLLTGKFWPTMFQVRLRLPADFAWPATAR